MSTGKRLRRAFLGRDVAVAYAIVLGLYLLKFSGFQPLQIPPYLLIVAYDVVEVVVPILTPYHPYVFPVFLYMLAVAGAGVARLVRSDGHENRTWLRIAGGVFLIVGSISLLFAAVVGGPVISTTDNPTPLAITGLTGIIFLLASWWLLTQRPSRSVVPRSDRGPD